MSIVNKPPNVQNQEISTPPTVETIKSSTTYASSDSNDSNFDELEHEILYLTDDSVKSNPFQLKKPHVKKNNKKNYDYYDEDESDDHQQSKFKKNTDRKESLIEKGEQLCRILSNSS